MRELIAADNPSADPEQVVQAYMVEVRKLAQGLQIKPNASGDYVYPQEQEAMLDKWRTSRGVLEVTNEFSPDLPHWADPLLEEYRTGNITPEREELLLRVVFFEVTSQLAG